MAGDLDPEEVVIVDADRMEQFMVDVFTKMGLTESSAREASEVLVAADIYGVESHGAPRFPNYINRLRSEAVKSNPQIRIVRELPSIATIDGDNGLGMVVGRQAMNMAIEKARITGAGFVSVRNSNHYGIAGFYARMALEHDMIGFSMTNTGSGGSTPPTLGTTGMFGTNPIAVAAPTKTEPAFVMDFATSVVAAGKLQIASRREHDVPLGWIVDKDSNPTTKPDERTGGGYILPVGGFRETAGHKGYGLMLLVDILSGVLSGAGVGANAAKLSAEGAQSERDRTLGGAANTGHFFGALRIDGFRSPDEFKEEMDEMFRVIRSSEKLDGVDRIIIHGEDQWEAEKYRRANGLPLDIPTYESLLAVSEETGIPLDIKR